MSPETTLDNSNQNPSEVKNLSIEIEPSYPLIVAITEFFRAQKKPQKALELSRLGLNYFPGDLGLRLGLAMSYLDLSEKNKAWEEIKTVVQELNQLAPILDSIAKHFQQKEQNKVWEWFHHLSLILSNPAEENPRRQGAPPGDPPAPSLFPEEEFQPTGNSQVHQNSPQGEMESQNYSQIAREKISFLSPGEKTNEKEKPREGLPDSNILSTLTGWLSQLKESKA
jgi:hypothetical protein